MFQQSIELCSHAVMPMKIYSVLFVMFSGWFWCISHGLSFNLLRLQSEMCMIVMRRVGDSS